MIDCLYSSLSIIDAIRAPANSISITTLIYSVIIFRQVARKPKVSKKITRLHENKLKMESTRQREQIRCPSSRRRVALLLAATAALSVSTVQGSPSFVTGKPRKLNDVKEMKQSTRAGRNAISEENTFNARSKNRQAVASPPLVKNGGTTNQLEKRTTQDSSNDISVWPCMDDLDKRLIKISLPVIANFAIAPLVGAIDLFFINRMGNALAVAGQAAANQVYGSLFWLTSFLPSSK